MESGTEEESIDGAVVVALCLGGVVFFGEVAEGESMGRDRTDGAASLFIEVCLARGAALLLHQYK